MKMLQCTANLYVLRAGVFTFGKSLQEKYRKSLQEKYNILEKMHLI